MQFIITAYDHTDEDAPARRMRVRPSHLSNLENVKKNCTIICAGGIKNSDGKPVGSFLIMDFENKDMLDKYLESEPYVTGRVWEDIRVEPCSAVILNNEKVGQ